MTATAAAEYGPTWYAANLSSVPECRVLAADIDVDVCVVGGGVAGLTAADALSRRGWSVAVLEAERIGAGGAGGGTGIVAPGYCASVEEMIERLGAKRAGALWSLSVEGVERVRATLAGAGEAAPAAQAALGSGLLVAERADREAAVAHNAALLRDRLGADVEYWPAAKVREVLRSRAFHQALYLPNALSIDPLRYLLDLTAALRRAGVRIYERSPVRAVDPAGIRKRVETATGTVRARHIVLAASGDLGALHPTLAGTVMRLACPIAVTAPLGPALAEAVRFPGAILSGAAAGGLRIVGGDRLMWIGPLTTQRANPRRLARSTSRAIRETFPQLENVEVEHAWHAGADYAVHRMPQIGQLAPGLWLAAAFTHHGFAAAAMAGEVIARAIGDNDDRWRLFQSYGLVWTGGIAGRAAVGGMLRLAQLRAALHRPSPQSGSLPPPEQDPAAPVAEAASSAPDEAPASAATQGDMPGRQRAKPRAAGPGGRRRRRLRLRTAKLAKRSMQAPDDSPAAAAPEPPSPVEERASPRAAGPKARPKSKRKSRKAERAERPAGSARVQPG